MENIVKLVKYNENELSGFSFYYSPSEDKFVEIGSITLESKDEQTLNSDIEIAKKVRCSSCQRKPITKEVYTDNIIVASKGGERYTANKKDLLITFHVLDRLNRLYEIKNNVGEIIDDYYFSKKEKLNKIEDEIRKYRS